MLRAVEAVFNTQNNGSYADEDEDVEQFLNLEDLDALLLKLLFFVNFEINVIWNPHRKTNSLYRLLRKKLVAADKLLIVKHITIEPFIYENEWYSHHLGQYNINNVIYEKPKKLEKVENWDFFSELDYFG